MSEELRFEIPEVEGDEDIVFFFDPQAKEFRARLPSGSQPLIQPVNPRIMVRLIQHYRSIEPQVPFTEVVVPGTKVAQQFEEPDDPEYKRLHAIWTDKFMDALLMRCIWSGLIVPEDNDWAETYIRTGIPVPSEGPERVEMYVEEVYPNLLGVASPQDQSVFVEAVRQLSIPTNAVVEAVRRKFRVPVARDTPNGSDATDGGVLVEHPDGGASGAGEVPSAGDDAMGAPPV